MRFVKIVTLTVAITVCFLGNCVEAQTKKGRQGTTKPRPTERQRSATTKPETPSLDETLLFIKEKLIETASLTLKMVPNDEKLRTLSFKPIKFDSCNIVWQVGYSIMDTNTFDLLPMSYQESSFQLADVDTTQTEAKINKMFPEVWQVSLRMKDDKNTFRHDVIRANGSRVGAYGSSLGSIFVRDKESAEKIVRAINHAGSLCKDRTAKEPF